MSKKIKVVHYINQFFGLIGGEEAASVGLEVREGMVGPGAALSAALGSEAEIVATIICGDNHIAENLESVTAEVVQILKKYSPDMFFAGPAYAAGRYGVGCGALCAAVKKELGIPAVTAMNEENPGVGIYRKDLYILSTGNNARTMKEDTQKMAALARKLLAGEAIGSPEDGGYFARGWAITKKSPKRSSDRAIDMLLKKIKGEPFKTEITMPKLDAVPLAPAIPDLSKATVVLVTDGGLFPAGNPDKMPPMNPTVYKAYSVDGLDTLKQGDYMVSHNGYDNTFAVADPNRLIPLDAMRILERKGEIGKLHENFLTTTGLLTTIANSTKIGKDMAAYIRDHQIDAAILTST